MHTNKWKKKSYVRGEFSWKSAKQSSIVTSSIEIEFVACFESTMKANWLQNFISRLGVVDNIAKLLNFILRTRSLKKIQNTWN